MRLNTRKSIELAKEVRKVYRTWEELRKASEYTDGKYILNKQK